MKRSETSPYAPLALVAVVAVGFFWLWSTYNTLVQREEHVRTAWSQVENQYQRRLDLIPNLVRVVQGLSSHERTTLERVMTARQKALDIAAQGSAASLPAYQHAQAELGVSLRQLMAVVESYPQISAAQSFRELQVQIEGTENRIAVERMRFNQSVQAYNTSLRRFPASLVASFLGFGPVDYFAADSGASSAPQVDMGASGLGG